MDLAQLQRAFQDRVLHEGCSIEAVIKASEQFPVTARLGIYTDAYRLRLIDVLAYYYPRLQQLLGAEAFAGLALSYLAAQPSTHVSVRWFGNRLASELGRMAGYRDQPWLAELASWEWALTTAFDAADADPLSLDTLGGIAADAWPDLRFQFHPSVQPLRLQSNAPELYRALADDTETPVPAVLHASQAWLIWRQDLAARYRLLDEAEADALRTMQGQPARENPGTFAELCETLCQFHDAEEVPSIAAGMLKTWITQGLIVAILQN